MKKLIAMALLMPLIAQADIILPDATSVGTLDTFIEEDAKVNNPNNQAIWVQGVLGDTSVDWTVSVLEVPYFSTSVTDVYAFEIPDQPEYFLIKNATRMALFANLVNLEWGVFDASLLSNAFNIPSSDFTISHVTSLESDGATGGGGGNVPEPGVLALLAMGLLGYVKRA